MNKGVLTNKEREKPTSLSAKIIIFNPSPKTEDTNEDTEN